MTACLVHGAGRPRFAAHLVQLALTAEADATWSDIRLQWEHDVVGVSRDGSLPSPKVGTRTRTLCDTIHAALRAFHEPVMIGGIFGWPILDSLAASFRFCGRAEVVINDDVPGAGTVDLVDAGVASLSLYCGTSTFKLTEPAVATALAWVLMKLRVHSPALRIVNHLPALRIGSTGVKVRASVARVQHLSCSPSWCGHVANRAHTSS